VISHQYRTPLSVIATNVEGIGMSLDATDAPNRRRIDRIRRAVGRLVAMIDVSLNRSRLDGPPLAPQRRPVAPGPMLRQAVQRVRDATGDRIIGLELDDSVDGVIILADPEMIELALINLMENAVKFSEADRPIDVTATAQGGVLRVAVHDQGIGIPRAELGHIFQKFYRAANASDRPGVGIGLQLVAQLVHAHGGEITVDSSENEGASFTISLPLAQAPATV
jgi:signal transduction histidine kinase